MMEPPGALGDANHGNTESHDERNDDPKTDGQLVHKADCSKAQAVMVIMEPAMWMFAQSGTTKLRICSHTPSFLAHSRLTDGSCGRLGSQSSCVSRI